MFKDRISKTKIPFCIFKIDRINFMRHSRRSDFSFLNPLLEIIHRNVLPNITAKVNENGIDPFQVIKKSSQVIVVLNLSCWMASAQSEMMTKFFSEFIPVNFRIGNMVGIKVSARSAKLS